MAGQPITFVCWIWKGPREYTAEHVSQWAAQIKKHYSKPCRIVCITDLFASVPGCEVIPEPPESRTAASIHAPLGPSFPSCYRRLWLFSEAARCLGPKILLLDVDCLIVGDLTPLVETPGDFVGWRTHHKMGNPNRIGGGTWMLKTGTHRYVWETFTYDAAMQCHRAGWLGSDQGWLSCLLSANCEVWPDDCGIYQRQDGVLDWTQAPSNARIIHFNGAIKQWDKAGWWTQQMSGSA